MENLVTTLAPSLYPPANFGCGGYTVFILPPANFVCGEYTVFTLSLRLCVRPSVRNVLFP